MIAVIGAGAMGEALMAGWIAAGTSPDEIVAGLPFDSYVALKSPSILFLLVSFRSISPKIARRY